MSEREIAVDEAKRKLRAWMLELLRFAVTQDPQDQINALASACELDTQNRDGEVTFFQRTSSAVCHAILVRDRNSERILAEYIRRIGDDRLRRAFVAALDMETLARSAKPGLKGQRLPRRVSIWQQR